MSAMYSELYVYCLGLLSARAQSRVSSKGKILCGFMT